VIAILIALILPAVQHAREAARRMRCLNNLRQIGVALHSYHGRYSVFPPGSQVADLRISNFTKSFGWPIALMPDLELRNWYDQFDLSKDCQSSIHRHLTSRTVPILLCPSDPLGESGVEWRLKPYDGIWGATNYLGVSGIGGLQRTRYEGECEKISTADGLFGIHSGMLFGNSSVRIADVRDGTSQTLFVGERGVVGQWGKWGGPGLEYRCPHGIADVVLPGVIDSTNGGLTYADAVADRTKWFGYHDGAANFLFVDGSVRRLAVTMDRNAFTGLVTKAAGEISE
jgi:prepilin-type processing-associated H-X9-DG protein